MLPTPQHARHAVRMKRVLITGAAIISAVACSRSFNRSNFEEVYRAGTAIDVAIEAGTTLDKYQELLHQLGTAIQLADDSAKTDAELTFIGAYRGALEAFSDAETVWTKNNRMSDGVIYVRENPELQRVLDRYKIPFERGGVGDVPVFRGMDGLRIIWQTAKAELQRAHAIYREAA